MADLKITQEEARQQFDNLPPIIKEAIRQSNWRDKVKRIVQKNKLHIDQGQTLEDAVFSTIAGATSAVEFTKEIRDAAILSDQQAIKITKEIDSEIFQNIKYFLINDELSGEEVDPELLAETDRLLEEAEKSRQGTPIQVQKQEPKQELERDNILNQIEDKPKPAQPQTQNKKPVFTPSNKPSPKPVFKDNRKPAQNNQQPQEPAIKATSSGSSEIKVSLDKPKGQKPEVAVSNKPYKVDPYREPLE